MDDSPGPEVRALLGDGDLRAGMGCEGAGRVGPTRVRYLLWARATEEEPSASAAAVEAAAVAEGHAAGMLRPAPAAATREALAASVAPGMQVPVRGVGLWCTRGQ